MCQYKTLKQAWQKIWGPERFCWYSKIFRSGTQSYGSLTHQQRNKGSTSDPGKAPWDLESPEKDKSLEHYWGLVGSYTQDTK